MHFYYYSLIIFAGTLCLSACNNNTASNKPQQIDSVSAQQEPPVTVQETPANLYIAWPIKTSDSLKKVFQSLSERDQKTLFALNRVDKAHIQGIDTIVVPTTFKEDLLSYSPFPAEVLNLGQVDKFVLFSYPIQAYAVYENGKLIKWGPTNMGKKSTKTPLGLFFTNWKGKEIKSSVNKSWILKWNFNISNLGGIGWHQYALPGYPASHSCLRLLADDAKWLYDWADQWIIKNNVQIAKGTPTIVYGAYPWGERRPWKFLLEDPQANNVSIETINALITPHLATISKAQEERKALNNIQTDTTINNTNIMP